MHTDTLSTKALVPHTVDMQMEADMVLLGAWAVFAGACVLTLLLGAVLSFHWYSYAMNRAVSVGALILYIAGSVLCLALIAATILSLS